MMPQKVGISKEYEVARDVSERGPVIIARNPNSVAAQYAAANPIA